MTFRIAAAAIFAFAFASTANAQTTPQPTPGPGDPRIKEFVYDPDAIVSIRGTLGYEMTIEFAPDERIENVSIGDSLSWQVTPNKKATLLFLKPMTKGATTSMTVVTSERIYTFVLNAVEPKGANDPNALLRLRFLYPPPPEPVVEQVEPLPPPRPEDFNFHYTIAGAKNLAPIRVFDDGKATYFQFDTRKDTPALFVVGPDNKEEIANTRVSGAYTIVDFTAETFVLRYGKTKLTVRNKQWKNTAAPAAAPLPQPRGN